MVGASGARPINGRPAGRPYHRNHRSGDFLRDHLFFFYTLPPVPRPLSYLLRAWHLDSFTKPSGTEMADKVPGNRWGKIPASAVFKIFLPGEEGVFFLFLPEMKKFRKIALLSSFHPETLFSPPPHPRPLPQGAREFPAEN
jgi:hypothetical protein